MLNFNKVDLFRTQQVEIDEEIEFSKATFAKNHLLNEVKKTKVVGKGYYDQDLDIFIVNADIRGTMVVPCAISLVDVDYLFEIDYEATYSFNSNDDQHILVKGDNIDLLPDIFQSILLEVPLKVVSKNAVYQKGDNFEVIHEENYHKESIDPRLAKLKEYKVQDD